MNELCESLYNARRNAISSWQGYHYQGMVALQCFLEELVKRYDISEDEAVKLKLKIEWIDIREKGDFMANILIVEDEKNMQDIISEYMRRGGHTCFTADDGVDALMLMKNNPVDLMVLDIMMPHLDGFSVCKTAREMSSLPIIMLTAKSDEEDKLKGYEYGADDYMTKPFSPKILLAKANALLRRTSAASTDSESDTQRKMICAGKIAISTTAHKVFLDDTEITLTHKEYELLHFFMSNSGQVFSREQLLNRIWGYDFEGNTRTVDTHIKHCGKSWAVRGNLL